jgi:hypothetical protein
MIVFGLPLYRLLRGRAWTSFWIAPLPGFLVGAVMWLGFSMVFGLALGEGTFGIRLALTDPSALKGMIWPGGVLGAGVAIVFWLIARPDS